MVKTFESNFVKKRSESFTVKVSHDLQRQILEISSLFRVMNNYYGKKTEIQSKMRPIMLKRFKEGLRTVENGKDWLFTIPTALNKLSDDFLKRKDSFRFPDSIILFEAYMNLGFKALYPRVVLHHKFPGFLKGEKTRNVFQFIYSTSRGFGFPIYFGPEFYSYEIPLIAKMFEPVLKWVYTVCHRINQAIYGVGDKFLNQKRHHPGEFESVIISEYENNIYKGIDTLLHGFFTKDPKYLGNFRSIKEALSSVMFYYSIGDHATSVENKIQNPCLDVPLITYEEIVQKYDIDLYAYIKQIMALNVLLSKKLAYYKKIRKSLINKLKILDKIQFRIEQWKNVSIPGQKLSKKFSEIEKFSHYKHLMEKIRELLWTTPLYTHTIHAPTEKEVKEFVLPKIKDELDEYEQDKMDSIVLSFVKKYELEQAFEFEEPEVIEELKSLRDSMAKMWLYFKERHFGYAIRKLNEITELSLDNPKYDEIVNMHLDKLIPIISIYEIFNRPLSESVYPESMPKRKKIVTYLAMIISSKYFPVGMNIMNLFNNLAFHNWGYFITRKKLNSKQYFDLMLRLPIWKHIPPKIKTKILSTKA